METTEMDTAVLGRTGRTISRVGLGCWQLGADWGAVSESDAMDVLHAAVEAGVTFLDTADVYGDGRSERLVGRLLAERQGSGPESGGPESLTVATKMGRRADPHVAGAYTLEAFRAWTDRSRANLGMDTLDLVQLHCPPEEVIETDRVFDDLDTLVAGGAIAAYGVSVETCEQALKAIARPGVASVQIILNIFRRKPLERVLPAAAEAGVGIVARVPLASGLLSGRYDETTVFAADDHRNFNRQGDAFDVGETFAGVPYDVGLSAAREVAALAAQVPGSPTTAQLALRWVLDVGATTVIPGARTPDQARANAAVGAMAPLPEAVMQELSGLYDQRLRHLVHHRW